MQININISNSYLNFIFIVFALATIVSFINYKFRIISTIIILSITLITFLCYNDSILINLINNNNLKIKSQNNYELESNFEIENRNGINYIIEIKDNVKNINNTKVNIIYDLNENTKPYCETIIYDAIIVYVSVIKVHLNKT